MRVGGLLFGCGLLLLSSIGCGSSEEPPRSRIAFAVDRAGTASDILLVDPAGGEPVPVAPAESADETPAWSPDGLTLLFASDRDGHRGIYSWDKRLEAIVMAQYHDYGPSWSPTGGGSPSCRTTKPADLLTAPPAERSG